MSQFTYTILSGAQTVVGSIRYWVQHTDLAVDQILEQAQQYIFMKLRVREMRVSETIAIATDESTLVIPTGFQDPISLRLYGDSEDLDYVHETMLSRQYDDDGTLQSGRPQRWAIFDELIQFDQPSDDDIGGKLIYYGTPTFIASGTETNILTTRYPTVLLDTLIAFGYKQRKRDNFASQLALAEKAIMDVNAADDMGRRGQLLR